MPESKPAPRGVRFVTFFVPLLACALAPVDARAQGKTLTIDEAVRLALTRNERAEIADLNVHVAAAAVERARAAFLPVLTAAGTDAYRPNAATTNSGTATLTLNQPLLNASAFPLYAQAKNALASQRAQTVDDRRLLAYDAARAFFATLSAAAVLQAAQRKLDSAKANLADTQARVQAQLVSSNDATRAELDVASAGRDVELDDGNVAAAIVALGFLLNVRVDEDLAAPEAFLASAQRPAGNPDELTRVALTRRPDLESKRLAALAAHDFANEPLLRLVPTIGLSAQAQGTTTPTATAKAIDESLSVTATWPIFDSGIRYADKHSRDASARIADLNTQALVRSVDSQVRSALATLVSAQAAFQRATEARDASRRSAEETGVLYRQGLAKAIELVDANDARFEAEVSYESARYLMAEAYLSLRQALGLDALGTELK
jgi:outer membrane protein TolC